ncbi:MAG TPA: zinc-dependent metalloprotease, partial [Aquabacterium sp.]|nr:zinc-dependent metalloprotease [Aquabacterium sp.]
PGSGRDLLDPLPFGSQRAALKLLTTRYLAPGAVSIPPGLQRRLAPDYQERGEGMEASGQPLATDFSVANQWLAVQRGVLNTLMADGLAERLLDNIDKTRDRQEAPLTLPELHRHLREAIWTDKGRDANPAWQRNVQREHVNRLATAVVRGSGRADVRAQLRQQARELMAQLQKPVSTRSMNRAPDSTAEAHRQDCLETLKRALSASVQRTTP